MANRTNKEAKGILIAIERYPPDYTGAGLRASRIADRMQKRYNHKFKILTLKNPENGSGSENAQDVHRINLLTPKIIFPIYLLELMIRINLFLRKHRPDIDIIHFYTFFWLNRLIMLSNVFFYHKKTLVEITLYGDDDPVNMVNKNLLNRLFGPITLFLFRRIDRFVVLNEDSLDSCMRSGIPKDRIWFRPNPIDEKKFNISGPKEKKTLRKKLGLAGKVVLLSVGAIRSRKNQLFLIEAVKRLKDPKVSLVLLGPANRDLPYHESLLKFVRENNLAKQIYMPGEKENVSEYASASDIFVFASEREGFSNAIGEAMMSGLPVITLYHNGIDKYINDKTGIVIRGDREGALDQFVDSLRKIVHRTIRFDRLRIRNEALKCFSTSKIDDEYNSVYLRL
jgi:glycosyltransferase involved in cell wall biosynthesis